MDTITRFGTGDLTYNFTPDNQMSIDTNFGNAVPQTTRLPGVSGGVDEYGSGVAPAEIGNISLTFWMFFADNADKTLKIDTLNRLQSWGVQRIFMQPTDPANGERYCEARVNNINLPQKVKNLPHKRIQAQINFQVANPTWLSQGTEAPRFDSGVLFDGGALFGGSAPTYAISGTQTDISIARVGSAITYPRVTLSCDTGETLVNPTVQRLQGGVVVEEFGYTGTLTAGDSLEVDCTAKKATLNAASAYNNLTFTTVAWLSLLPATQTIRVVCDNGAAAGSIRVRYFEAYH
ncbi:MAG: phage distal tail protein [Aggregatilineales bacterium]